MAQSPFYGVPVGLLRGQDADTALKANTGFPLAGTNAAFTQIRILEKGKYPILRNAGEVYALRGERPEVREWFAAVVSRRPDSEALKYDKPLIMGVLNVTPDSFSDGGRYLEKSSALEQAERLRSEGADIIDIGGESTRPGADIVDVEEERRRVVPVMEALREAEIPFSIDTRKSLIMAEAIARGAALINDVSALSYDEKSVEVLAKSNVPIVLMQAPSGGDAGARKMSDNLEEGDITCHVFDKLAERIRFCTANGIAKSRIIVDPGLGFGKTLAGNISLLQHIGLLHSLGVPVLVGASRKRFIGEITGIESAEKRDVASVAASLLALKNGVQIVRMHDVVHMKQSLDVYLACTG